MGGGKGGGGKSSGGGNKRRRSLNPNAGDDGAGSAYSQSPAQKRFKQRESQGLSGLTGREKGTKSSGPNSTLGKYRQYQQDSIRANAGNQEAAKRLAESNQKVADIRAKNLATGTDLGVTTQQNVSQASSNLGIYNNYEGQIAGKFATTLADTSNLYNCRIESTELNALEEENEYVVLLVWKGQHTGNIS